MNIGILTFVDTNNYGAALQGYALQQVIKREGHSCEIIKYSCKEIQEAHDPQKVIRKNVVKRFFSPVLLPVYRKIYREFRKFEDEYCTFSIRCDKSTIAKVVENYDKIIVGSDQVWNIEITGDDRTYFLDFIKEDNKKCSYAASVGTKYFTQNSAEYETLIKHFQVISVREKGTAEILQKKIKRDDISADVDPTLLIIEQWSTFVLKDNKYGKYIFLYFIPEDPVLFKSIRKFAKEKGCKLILLQRSIRKRMGIQTVNVASPIDFINMIAHAQYVISGSFHALCFSLIFHKDFYVTAAPRKDRNERLMNLLSSLEQKERFVVEPEYHFSGKEIDFEVIDNKLKVAIESSMNTIKKICVGSSTAE